MGRMHKGHLVRRASSSILPDLKSVIGLQKIRKVVMKSRQIGLLKVIENLSDGRLIEYLY